MSKGCVVLGSTGSIGRSTMDVLEGLSPQYHVCALAANHNWRLLAEQARRWNPDLVVVAPEHVDALRTELRDRPTRVLATPGGLIEAATHPDARVVVSALVGTAGLPPTLAAIQAGKDIALANKETLVAAGALMTSEAQRYDVRLLPVDSEHSAVFQCLQGVKRDEVKRLILTASGGPFRGRKREDLKGVTPEQAVAHPRWNMGAKISVDSATLMNKGLEVIEARWLFGLPAARIDIVVHPQSIVHSLVELVDGAVLAHLNLPDMRHPIQYALTYPHRYEAPGLKPLQLAEVGTLTFERPDFDTFDCLNLALQAASVGGTMPAVLNAANEVAVQAFLDRRLSFMDIASVVRQTMEAHESRDDSDLQAVMAADQWARTHAHRVVQRGGR